MPLRKSAACCKRNDAVKATRLRRTAAKKEKDGRIRREKEHLGLRTKELSLAAFQGKSRTIPLNENSIAITEKAFDRKGKPAFTDLLGGNNLSKLAPIMGFDEWVKDLLSRDKRDPTHM